MPIQDVNRVGSDFDRVVNRGIATGGKQRLARAGRRQAGPRCLDTVYRGGMPGDHHWRGSEETAHCLTPPLQPPLVLLLSLQVHLQIARHCLTPPLPSPSVPSSLSLSLPMSTFRCLSSVTAAVNPGPTPHTPHEKATPCLTPPLPSPPVPSSLCRITSRLHCTALPDTPTAITCAFPLSPGPDLCRQ